MRIYATAEQDFDLLRQAKAAAALEGRTLTDWLREAIRERLQPDEPRSTV